MATQGTTYGDGTASFFDTALGAAGSFAGGPWKNAPQLARLCDPSIAAVLDESWQDYDATNTYTLTQATSGTGAISTTIPGTLTLDSGAVTSGQGVQIQRLKSAFIPAANKSIWFEARVSLTATAPPVTRGQVYVGLAASDTSIISGGAQTTNNRIGWQILTGALLQTTFTADKAGTAATKTGPLLVAATAINLGFFYDGAADTLQQFVNGVATGTAVATANIAKLVMYPSFVCQADGTDQAILNIHGYRVMQLR